MTQVDLLTPEELAAQLKCSTSTLKRWRRQQIGPPWIRAISGGGVRYPVRGFTDWITGMSVMTFAAADKFEAIIPMQEAKKRCK
jgi:hypothetical protein